MVLSIGYERSSALPKSIITSFLPPSRNIFSGFKSLCIISLECSLPSTELWRFFTYLSEKRMGKYLLDCEPLFRFDPYASVY